MFSGRLQNVKQATVDAYKAAIAKGRKRAEKDFPEIVKAIELSSLKASCRWGPINNPFPNGSSPPLLYDHYCNGYKNRLVELIDNSGFSVEIDGPSDSHSVTIDWFEQPGFYPLEEATDDD